MTNEQLRTFVSRISFELLDEELGECWIWTGSRLRNGYGRMSIRGWQLAHRLSHEHFVGPIADGMQIDHLCRHVACVNPRHLEAVTQATNCRRGMFPIVIKALSKCRVFSPLTRQRMREAQLGRKHSGATIAKIRSSSQGRVFVRSDAQAFLGSARMTGKKHNDATRARIAEGRRRAWALKKGAA